MKVCTLHRLILPAWAGIVWVLLGLLGFPGTAAGRPSPTSEAFQRLREREVRQGSRQPWTDFQERSYRRDEPIVLCAGFGDATGSELLRPPGEEAYLLAQLLGPGPAQSIPLRDDGRGADARAGDQVFCTSLTGLTRADRYRLVLLPRHAPGYESRALEFSVSGEEWLQVLHPRGREPLSAEVPLLVEILVHHAEAWSDLEVVAVLLGQGEGEVARLNLKPADFSQIFSTRSERALPAGLWRIRFELRGRAGRAGVFRTVAVHHFELLPPRSAPQVSPPEQSADEPEAPGGADSWWSILLSTLALALGGAAFVQVALHRRQVLRALLDEALEARPVQQPGEPPPPPIERLPTPSEILLAPPQSAGFTLTASQRQQIVEEVLGLLRAASPPSVRAPDQVAAPRPPDPNLNDEALFDDLLSRTGEPGEDEPQEELVGLDQADIDELVASMTGGESSPVARKNAGPTNPGKSGPSSSHSPSGSAWLLDQDGEGPGEDEFGELDEVLRNFPSG